MEDPFDIWGSAGAAESSSSSATATTTNKKARGASSSPDKGSRVPPVEIAPGKKGSSNLASAADDPFAPDSAGWGAAESPQEVLQTPITGTDEASRPAFSSLSALADDLPQQVRLLHHFVLSSQTAATCPSSTRRPQRISWATRTPSGITTRTAAAREAREDQVDVERTTGLCCLQ